MRKIIITTCGDCPYHEVLCDPDPHDWFNSDDVKVRCKATGKIVDSGIRPYQVGKVVIPASCPLEHN
jgi:hypothetical protein